MKKPLRTLLPILGFIFCSSLSLPTGSDIWLFDTYYNREQLVIGGGSNISNNPGYDNQPAFSEQGSFLLYASARDSIQTDIIKYDVSNRFSTRLTQTKESEFSPTFAPGNKYISTVVVEKDSSQRLWLYNKTTLAAKPALEREFGVGYHCWFDDNTVFLFSLTNPFSLRIADVRAGKSVQVASNIGRSMCVYRSAKQKMVLYTQLDNDSILWIKALDGKGNAVQDFKPIKALEGSQDMAIDRFGNIYMAAGTKIYIWGIGRSFAWEPYYDFKGLGLKNITRIAIAPNGKHMAVVDNQD